MTQQTTVVLPHLTEGTLAQFHLSEMGKLLGLSSAIKIQQQVMSLLYGANFGVCAVTLSGTTPVLVSGNTQAEVLTNLTARAGSTRTLAIFFSRSYGWATEQVVNQRMNWRTHDRSQ